MIKCTECGMMPVFKWSNYDKNGNFVNGMCVHGRLFEEQELDTVDILVNDAKRFVEFEGNA